MLKLLEDLLIEQGMSACYLISEHFEFKHKRYYYPLDDGDRGRVARKIKVYPELKGTLVTICMRDDNWRPSYFKILEMIENQEIEN